MIIVHHFAFRVDAGVVNLIMRKGGGHYALTIFLLLSAYGIAQSEKFHPTNFYQYFRRRIPKLLIPYFIIFLFTAVTFWLVGGYADEETLAAYRINPSFVELGQHEAGVLDIFKYIFGIKTFCVAYWFVGVTLMSYIAFGVAKSIKFHLRRFRRLGILMVYSLFLVAFAFFTYHYEYPAHYYRNLWALVAGLTLSLYEKEFLNLDIFKKLIALVCLNILIVIWFKLTSSGGFRFLIYIDGAFLSIWFVNMIFMRYELKRKSLLASLAGISYCVYLIHGTVLTVEWWYIGFSSALIAVAVSLLLAAFFQFVIRFINI